MNNKAEHNDWRSYVAVKRTRLQIHEIFYLAKRWLAGLETNFLISKSCLQRITMKQSWKNGGKAQKYSVTFAIALRSIRVLKSFIFPLIPLFQLCPHARQARLHVLNEAVGFLIGGVVVVVAGFVEGGEGAVSDGTEG